MGDPALVPYPKKLEKTGIRYRLTASQANAVLVVSDTAGIQGENAARFIAGEVLAIAGIALPIIRASALRGSGTTWGFPGGGSSFETAVVLAGREDVSLLQSLGVDGDGAGGLGPAWELEPKEQGYSIRCLGGAIVCVAHDSDGLMAAAATIVQMLEFRDGALACDGMNVDDWPDIPYRGAWVWTQNFLHIEDRERIIAFLRWCAAHKLNYLLFHYDGGGEGVPFPRALPVQEDWRIDRFNDTIELAQSYGIKASLVMPHFLQNWQGILGLSDDEKREGFREGNEVLCPSLDTTFSVYRELISVCLTIFPKLDGLWFHVSEAWACSCSECEAKGGFLAVESSFHARVFEYARALRPGLDIGLWRGHTPLARYNEPDYVILCPWRYQNGEENLVVLSRNGCPVDDEQLFRTPNPKAFTMNSMGFPGIPYEYEPISEIARINRLCWEKGCSYVFPMWVSSLVFFTDGCLGARAACAEFSWNARGEVSDHRERFCRRTYGEGFLELAVEAHRFIEGYTVGMLNNFWGLLGTPGWSVVELVFSKPDYGKDFLEDSGAGFRDLLAKCLTAAERIRAYPDADEVLAKLERLERTLRFWHHGGAEYLLNVVKGAEFLKGAMIYHHNFGDTGRAQNYLDQARGRFGDALQVLVSAYAEAGYTEDAFDSPEWRRTLVLGGYTISQERLWISDLVKALETDPYGTPAPCAAKVVQYRIPFPLDYNRRNLVAPPSTRLPLRGISMPGQGPEESRVAEQLLTSRAPATWLSSPETGWPVVITVDFGQIRYVNGVCLIQAHANVEDMTRGYEIELSSDGKSWEVVASNSLLPISGAVQTTKFPPRVAQAMRIRLVSSHGGDKGRVGIAGLGAYQPWLE